MLCFYFVCTVLWSLLLSDNKVMTTKLEKIKFINTCQSMMKVKEKSHTNEYRRFEFDDYTMIR